MSEGIAEATLVEWEQRAREAQERVAKTTPGRWKLWGMDVYAGTSNVDTAVRVAHEDVHVLSAATLAQAAEIRRLQARLDRVTHERECLGAAISDVAYKAGISNGLPMTGPELILMAHEMVNVILRAQSEQDDRVAGGGMAVVDVEEAE